MIDPYLQQTMVALQPRLRRFAYGLTGSMDDADELVQCTYERALQRLDQWQRGSRLDSWMFRILQSINFNLYRAARVRGEDKGVIDPDTQGSDLSMRKLEAGMILERVRELLLRLPEEQRSALMLVAVEGFSYKEAASVLDVPVGTLTSRLARGRLALMAMMDNVQSQDGRSNHAPREVV
jgi:RNA polymerase sigma-70 factor (ECF subfamily)